MINEKEFNKIIEQFDKAEKLLNEDIANTHYIEVFEKIMPIIENKQLSRDQASAIHDKIAKSRELFAVKKDELTKIMSEQTNRVQNLQAYVKNSYLKK